MPSGSRSEAPIVIGVGELLWDRFEGGDRRPGGAPANVAFHANQLGLRGIVCSRVGTDDLGDEILAYLRRRGLAPRYVQRDAERPTGTVDVHDARTGPSYTIHENVAWDRLAWTDDWADVHARCAAVCYGTLAQRTAGSRATILRGLEHARAAWRVYDVNLRPPFVDAAWIENGLRQARVVKLNHEELPQIAAWFGVDAPRPAAQAQALRARYELELVCVTRGEHGCLLVADTEIVDIPGARVDVRDTVGAGDAYTAALVSGLIWGWPLEAVGRLANDVGGLVASRDGAMPDLRAEFDALRRRHEPRA